MAINDDDNNSVPAAAEPGGVVTPSVSSPPYTAAPPTSEPYAPPPVMADTTGTAASPPVTPEQSHTSAPLPPTPHPAAPGDTSFPDPNTIDIGGHEPAASSTDNLTPPDQQDRQGDHGDAERARQRANELPNPGVTGPGSMTTTPDPTTGTMGTPASDPGGDNRQDAPPGGVTDPTTSTPPTIPPIATQTDTTGGLGILGGDSNFGHGGL